jgi:hypothetical protein
VIDITTEIKSFEQKNLFSKIFSFVKAIGFEGFIWITALLYLAFFVNPFEIHFTICPLSNLGFEHCPGCGLGNSIALIFRGDIIQSFDAHILGIPALLIILHRIFSIIKFNLKREQIQNQ